jgi:signal transduction histidine kinase/DNA-binding response OmpR family regulator
VARERDANLICYPAKPLRSRSGFDAQANILYDLIGPERLDALVLWVAGLTLWVGLDELQQVCERYRPLPMVSAGGYLDGIPGVMVDNYCGMRDVVSHLIEVHGRKRLAFIRGPEQHQEADDRLRAFSHALKEHGLTLDPALLAQGDFTEEGGVRAAGELLNSGARFDALVAASDNMALGAMRTLQSAGMRVPTDASVGGVNNETQSHLVTPPLTTSALRFHDQAARAAELALAVLEGEEVPERSLLSARLIVRQSCGCPDPLVTSAGLEVQTSRSGQRGNQGINRDELLVAMVRGAEFAGVQARVGHTAAVIDAFLDEVIGWRRGAFIERLDAALAQSASDDEAIAGWQGALSALRCQALAELDPLQSDRAETLLHQGRVLVGEVGQRARAHAAFRAEEQARQLAGVTQALSIAENPASLAAELATSLPGLGIASAYLSLYDDPAAPGMGANLAAAWNGEEAFDASVGVPFDPRLLAPSQLLPAARRWRYVVEPLYFREDQLGLLLLEADPAADELCEIIRGQVSAAIKRSQLARRTEELYLEAIAASRVAEEGRRRAEEADQLKSRFLATVSHELRTPLTLITGTIEMMGLEGPYGEGRAGQPDDPFRRDLASIRNSAQHLSRLIADVLDLASSQAGALRLVREPVDMLALLREVEALAMPMVRDRGLEWRTQLSGDLPFVLGDRTRLRQVTLNMISNAVKFTESGYVTLSARAEGDMVFVDVTDTGIGVSPEDQEWVFDEFRRSKRALSLGYGGIGLGLAISRRLIELHGGKISVRSSGIDGAGSVFSYSLPALPEPSALERALPARPGSIVLLSERPETSSSLSDYLGERGYDVEVLSVVEHTAWLEEMVAAPPGAVLLDFAPAADRGWELMLRLKENPSTQDVPVIFLALAGDRGPSDMLALDYLVKPAGAVALARAMERQGIGKEDCATGRTILVVDDDPAILELHARMVRDHVPGCRVLAAGGGAAALDLVRTEDIDLVLLDLMMPDIDGFAVLEAMREEARSRHTPVIVLTAQILTHADMQRLQQGVAAVLAKGIFTNEEVLARVAAALDGNPRLGDTARQVVRRAMAYLHASFAEPLTRDEIAQQVAVSERYLTRCFQREIGLAPMTYLTRYRVHRAKEMLAAGGMTVTEVAHAVGFSDAGYFSRVFREEVGTTPGAFRSR